MRQRILALLAEGKTYNQIVAELGCAKSTVAYHAKNVKEPPNYKVYDWTEVQKYYDEGHSANRCMVQFGICRAVWYSAKSDGRVVTRPRRIPVEVLMLPGRRTVRTHLKKRLIEEGLLEQKCSRCGITEWLGEPLSITLHHCNGINNDNRLENLVMLCPHCHSQTETFSGRNVNHNTKK